MWVNEDIRQVDPDRGIEGRRRSPAAVVEVAGPAGAGKTTVAWALADRHADFRVGVPLSRLDLVRAYAPAAAAIAPTYLRRFRGTRWFSRGESRGIAYLGGWGRRLARDRRARRAGGGQVVYVLDHGPI